jgi:hypothetical protein
MRRMYEQIGILRSRACGFIGSVNEKSCVPDLEFTVEDDHDWHTSTLLKNAGYGRKFGGL